MTPSDLRAARLAVLCSALTFSGCDAPNADKGAAPAPIGTELAPYVLDSVPSDIKNPVFFDFEGKVHLIGYDLEPAGVIAPGSRVKLKLYWKCVSSIGQGVRVFTHLVDVNGRQVQKNLDDIGVLRQRDFTPSKWEIGKVYVDELEFELDKSVRVPEVTVAVGLWRAIQGREDIRLDPISGAADRERRALVARFKTGIEPVRAPAARAPQPKS